MTDALTRILPPAQDALGGFLTTLLGTEASLELGTPEPVADLGAAGVVLKAAPASGPAFAVSFGDGWADRLGQAMVGAPVPPEEAGDLLGEAAGQGYGALRTALSGDGLTLPDATFAPADLTALATLDWRVPFRLTVEGDVLEGAAFLADIPDMDTPASSNDAQAPVAVSSVAFDDLGAESIGDGSTGELDLLADVELEVTVELGRRRLPLADVLRLTTGSVIELDKLVGQPLAVDANGRLIAEGEAVVIDDQFGVRVTSLATAARPRPALT